MVTRIHAKLLALPLLLLTAACASTGARLASDDHFGVLVMAHGGTDEWNRALLDAVEPLSDKWPVEVALGMADAATIQESIRRLEAVGVEKIGIVRLFISGESWLERTQQILGVLEGASERPATSSRDNSESSNDVHGHADHAGPTMEFWRIETRSSFALSLEGLSEAEEMDQVILERARSLSRDPSKEDVLILAHGPADDQENERWIANISDRADLIRGEISFRRIEVMTLREDWTGKREAAEAEIRAYVQQAYDEGGRAIVIPYRVHGFGPYKEVLEGLQYEANEQGLLPHPAVTKWIDRQASTLRRGPFLPPFL